MVQKFIQGKKMPDIRQEMEMTKYEVSYKFMVNCKLMVQADKMVKKDLYSW